MISTVSDSVVDTFTVIIPVLPLKSRVLCRTCFGNNTTASNKSAPHPNDTLTMLSEDEVTTEWLQKELSDAETSLACVERQREKLSKRESTEEEMSQEEQSPLQRLIHLQDTVEYLQLADDIVQCQKKQQSNKSLISEGLLEQQVMQCEIIGQLLCRHSPPALPESHYGKLFGLLWEQEYKPLYAHAKWSVIASLRQLLQRAGYPAIEGCSKLMITTPDTDDQNKLLQTNIKTTSTDGKVLDSPSFGTHCKLLTRLQQNHRLVVDHVVNANYTISTKPARVVLVETSFEIMTVELLRPIVERVRYHFVDKRAEQPKQKSSSKQETASVTVSRLDHLPEWIITYIREHVLIDGGPWDLIRNKVAPYCAPSVNVSDMQDVDDSYHVLVYFLNEVLRLIQWVLIERNFFRDAQVAGPRSNPILLCRAVEQLMTLDAELRDMLPAVAKPQRTNQLPHPILLKLTDMLIAHDDDLLQWWLEREREFALSTLFEDDPSSTDTSTVASASIKPLWQFRIAPRAELFCVLMRSIQSKAANFTNPRPYLSQVAVPLCMKFLDAIHETSRDLRSFLSRRKLPEELDLRTNLLEWMDLINGTYLSASVLLKGSNILYGDPDTPETKVQLDDHDLGRLGRSLERLQMVLVDEFGSGFVENLLMERAKLASYLMQAPHMLSNQYDDEMDTDIPSGGDIPAELQTVKGLLDLLLQVCDAVLAQMALAASEGENRETETSLAATCEVAKFAAQAMKRNVLNRLAEKFLEIIVDEGMVPEIVDHGAKKFAIDIRSVFGEETEASGPLMSRLMEVASFLTLPAKQLLGLKSALIGLTRSYSAQQLLDVRQIAADGTIYDEAVSMIRAKGFVSLDLEDVISILNRRTGIVM